MPWDVNDWDTFGQNAFGQFRMQWSCKILNSYPDLPTYPQKPPGWLEVLWIFLFLWMEKYKINLLYSVLSKIHVQCDVKFHCSGPSLTFFSGEFSLVFFFFQADFNHILLSYPYYCPSRYFLPSNISYSLSSFFFFFKSGFF